LLALARRPEAGAAIEEIARTNVAVHQGGRGGLIMARAIVAGRTDPECAAALAIEADALLGDLPMWHSLVRRVAADAATTDGWSIPDGWLPEAERTLRHLGYHAAGDACRRLRDGTPSAVPATWARFGITSREAEVLALVIEGHSNREIGECLFVSVRTVEKHVESLLRKTGTKTRTQLAAITRTT
jgi:DNA-binding CsgD family transcriptional regulator